MPIVEFVCLLLLGLASSTLAMAGATPAPSPTTTTASDNSSTGDNQSVPAGIHDYLPQEQKTLVCMVNVSAPLCPSVGVNDTTCSAYAAAVNGSVPECVAPGVCSFIVTPVNTTGESNVVRPYHNFNSTTTVSTTTANPTNMTTAETTTRSSTNLTKGSNLAPLPPTLNTAYISCAPVPSNFVTLMVCPNGETTFVYPWSKDMNTRGNATTPSPGNKTKNKDESLE